MMAALVKTHVQVSGLEEEPQVEEDQSDADVGSDEEQEKDGENDGDGEEEEEDDDDEEEEDDGEADGDEDGEGDGEEAEEEGEEGAEGEGNANAGWADAMAKILGKKGESKGVILVKNKELDKSKEKAKKELEEMRKQSEQKRAWEAMSREKPDIVKDRENEKALQRIATRGVVQLFNAVRKHQKTVDDKVKEAGGSERKKAKFLSTVSKKDFIDVLRRSEGGPAKTDKEAAAAAEDEKPAWSVLRDDFMMGASMKDWDKDSDREEEEGGGGGGEVVV